MSKPNQSLQLNQSNLQDYLDCPRRFQLTVIDGLSLPAAYSEPIEFYEKSTLLGNRFHLICQQFFSGIDPVLLENSLSDSDLQSMWDNFLPYGESLLQYRLFPEPLLSISFLDHKLVAKYDLIVELNPEQYIIIDWKTAAKKSPRAILDKRLQTHLYPFIFNQAGNDLFPEISLSPALIEMHYWYPLASEHEEVFPYSDNKNAKVKIDLEKILAKINNSRSEGADFPLTDNKTTCKYCVFRSLCNRGTTAGTFEKSPSIEHEDLTNVQFDIDQVSEIEF
jgi:CRISPR/Cas system-associated exonuclease Cas4 (RecB family)